MKPGIYSYADLKGKIQVGDIVRAVPGKLNPCAELLNDGSNQKPITSVSNDGLRIDNCYHSFEDRFFLEMLSSTVSPADHPAETFPSFFIIENGSSIRSTASTAAKARAEAARILAEATNANLSIVEVKHSWTVERVVTAKLHKQ